MPSIVVVELSLQPVPAQIPHSSKALGVTASLAESRLAGPRRTGRDDSVLELSVAFNDDSRRSSCRVGTHKNSGVGSLDLHFTGINLAAMETVLEGPTSIARQRDNASLFPGDITIKQKGRMRLGTRGDSRKVDLLCLGPR